MPGLVVGFQEVVHSDWTENADVTNVSDSRGGPNGHPEECASDAQRSRDDGSRGVGLRAVPGRCGAPVQHEAEDRRQMDRADLQLALDWCDMSQPNEVWASRYHPGFAAAMSFLTQSSKSSEGNERSDSSSASASASSTSNGKKPRLRPNMHAARAGRPCQAAP